MRILLVDDDIMVTEMLSFKLSQKGFEVENASNGWDALNRLTKYNYDLLITDLMMPDISGLTLLSLLKNYVFGKVPVIVISSLNQSSTILSGIGLGAEDYFVKPINIEKLVGRINQLTNSSA